jgi:nucleoside-diphosphate-sugar epimerase
MSSSPSSPTLHHNPLFDTCIIFGGTGFIGSHFAAYLVHINLFRRIILADILPIRETFKTKLSNPSVSHSHVDVRVAPSQWLLPRDGVDLVANFAAIHREPGHAAPEYYETNLLGAENVCQFAQVVDCSNIIFTSSIAPYGPSESIKTEQSLPLPVSPYGCSKLVAEKIHGQWQRARPGRRLLIVRPGVVFGPGELGNVTRLVQATLRGYFMFMGNHETRKAAGYVKELAISLMWMLDKIPSDGGELLYNFGMPDPPSVKEFVDTTFLVSGHRRLLLSLPYNLILTLAYIIDFFAKPLRIRHPFSPVRIKKLVRSNNIRPQVLVSMDYPFQYSLYSAMLDWRSDSQAEWH